MYRTILCLFDTDEATDTLRRTLGPATRVVVVSTVLGALQELKKFTPEMILVQVGLKDESCFDFFKTAQLMIDSKNVPMIAVCLDEAFHETIEPYIRKTCSFFGCRCYLNKQDFESDALRFQLCKLMREAQLTAAC